MTGRNPYTFGYGTQFYPDGSPVKSGHCVTKQKALEYLLCEIHLIEEELDKLKLYIDQAMKNALVSFFHSLGWVSFLYSTVIDDLEGQVKRMLDFLELPFEESCITFYETDRSVRTASSEQVRKPVNKSGQGRWKPYAKNLGALVDSLDYKLFKEKAPANIHEK